MADTAAACWMEPDHGIWEVRGEPRHFVYSKLQCWVAMDRGIAMAERLDALDRVADWTETRAAIRSAVETCVELHGGVHPIIRRPNSTPPP